MRVLAAALLMAVATFGAEASSILVIGDNGEIRGSSVDSLSDGRVLAASPSVITLGSPPAAVDADIEEEDTAKAAVEPLSIPPLPIVIRAGAEGQAFTRALDMGGAGSTQTGESEDPGASVPSPAAAKRPVTPEPAQAAAEPKPQAAAPKPPAPVRAAPQEPAAPQRRPE